MNSCVPLDYACSVDDYLKTRTMLCRSRKFLRNHLALIPNFVDEKTEAGEGA